MGLITNIDALVEADLAALTKADKLLADALASYAKQQAIAAQETNKKLLGIATAYKAKINGRAVTGDVTAGVLIPEIQKRGLLEIEYEFDVFQALARNFLPQAAGVYLYWQLRKIVGLHLLIGGGTSNASPSEQDTDDDDLFKWIARELRRQSPIQSGTYRDSHVLMTGGEEVANAREVASGSASIPEAGYYIFANPLPYARRIEIGRTKSGRSFVVQVENRIYERIADEAASRFRNFANIDFDYVLLADAYVVTGRMQQRTPRYQTGKVRLATQTHWQGTNSQGQHQGWVTYRRGEPKTRIRRNETNRSVQSPAIIIRLK